MLIKHLQAVLVLILPRGRWRPTEGQHQSKGRHSIPGSKSSALSTGLEGAGARPQTQVRVSGSPRAQRFLLLSWPLERIRKRYIGGRGRHVEGGLVSACRWLALGALGEVQ